MTGRELIIYILQNNLEDEDVLIDGSFVGFMTGEEVAEQFNVGMETVNVWAQLQYIPTFTISGTRYFPRFIEDPRRAFLNNMKG